VKWLPRPVCITLPLQFSHIGYLVGRQDPGFHEFSRHAAIYQIILDLNLFKCKFELEPHKLHFKKFEGKYLEVP
jgi:hypothetical protein